MSDTQELLRKIAALRQRLDQAQASVAGGHEVGVLTGMHLLERKVEAGFRLNALLESSLRSDAVAPRDESRSSAPRLTARGSWLLQRGREYLQLLRALADDPLLPDEGPDPLSALYRDVAALIDMVLRTVSTFPASAGAQVRLCDGLEVVLGVVEERLAVLTAALSARRREKTRLDTLTALLTSLATGKSLALGDFQPLAEELVEDAHQGLALRFLSADPTEPARFVAAHGLNTAQVMARMVADDPEWLPRLHEPVEAALLHDVGMIQLSGEMLAQPGAFDDAQRRLVESHPRLGAEMLSRICSGRALVTEAAAAHHERSDGTGYPAGLRELQVHPLVRLLAVCDVYAARCAARPYRPPCDTRTALTDTLLLADRGALDRFQAERLLRLSFYPPGSVVELNDGAVGVVVAAQRDCTDARNPARPVVSLLTDSQRQPLPVPRQVDLAEGHGRAILRALPEPERRTLLGKRYPALV
jgi:hypothetical protein